MRNHVRPRRLAATALAGAMALGLAACSGDDAEEPTPTETTATPSPDDEATAAFEKYWDAYVQMANSGVVTADGFAGLAEGGFVETDLKILRDQADTGVVRVGGPTFSPYDTTVDGSTATSIVCVDFSGWGGKSADGKDLPAPPKTAPSPYRGTLELRDDAWVLVERAYEKDLPCPSA